MEISLKNPTGRNTPARVLTLGDAELFWSYDTCIAFRGPIPGAYTREDGATVTGWATVRLDNHWGPTTGRHMNELGVRDFDVVDAEAFERIVGSAFAPREKVTPVTYPRCQDPACAHVSTRHTTDVCAPSALSVALHSAADLYGTEGAATEDELRELAREAQKLEACRNAVLEWARTPGDHGGNPYTKDFVRLARATVKEG